MRQSNSTLIKALVAPGAILQTVIKDKEGTVVVRREELAQFITVTPPHTCLYDERYLWN